MSVVSFTPTSSQNTPQEQEYRSFYHARIKAYVPLVTTGFSIVAAVYFAVLATQRASVQLFVVAGVYTIAALFGVFAATGMMFKNEPTGIMVMNSAFQLAVLTTALMVTGMAIPGSAIILFYSLIIASSSLRGRRMEWTVNLGIILGACAAIFGTVSPFHQVSIPQLFTLIAPILSILALIYLSLVMMQFVISTMRIKLISSTLAVVLIPLVLLAIINSQFTQNALRTQINQSLDLAAQQTADKLDEFLNDTKETVAYQASLPVFYEYLSLDPKKRDESDAREKLDLTIDTLKFNYDSYMTSIAILNMFGENVYDTAPSSVGKSEKDADYFTVPAVTEKSYVSPILFSQDSNGSYIYFAAPIRSPQQQLIGVLRVRFDALIFQTILEESSNSSGIRSHPILIDENQLRIADTLTPSLLYRTVSALPYETILALRQSNRLPYKPNSELTTNLTEFSDAIKRFQSNPYFSLELHPNANENHIEAGAFATLKNQAWTLIYVQEQESITETINNQNKVSTLAAALIASLVGLFATLMARAFSNPIQKLTETAAEVASGDMTARAIIRTNDEIGTLANVFNSMTAQLSVSINELEDRVNDRTQELASQNQELVYRSRQLQTVSDVARGIAGAQDLETLLTQITTLISERFNYYHVGVFLLDEKREFAVLRAANSEGGKRMLARQHKLEIGKVGIVGYVTSTGNARIATDVGEDAVYFDNPDLPETRSEMALPLMVSGEIIGALDVQSTVSNAFSTQDISLFNTLADQVAIAIENNRLFTETARALEEAQNTHRQYLQQVWDRELAERQHPGFVFTPQGLTVREPVENALDLLQEGEDSPVTAKMGDNRVAAAVPIRVRGQTVGVIRVQDSGAGREWTEDELNTMKSVADQVAVAIENARLFEQTVRRAEREKKAMEITNKIRSTNDPNEMLRIAAEELQGALKASRAQIILDPSGTSNPGPSNGNGSGDHQNNVEKAE